MAKSAALDLSDLIDMHEAAELLGVSHYTVRRWVAEDRLAGYRLGPRRLRVSRSDAADLVRPLPNARSAGVASYVERLVAEAPSLTEEQRGRLAALLRSGTSETP